MTITTCSCKHSNIAYNFRTSREPLSICGWFKSLMNEHSLFTFVFVLAITYTSYKIRHLSICWAANPSAWSVSLTLSTHDQFNLTQAACVGCRVAKSTFFTMEFKKNGLIYPPWVKGLIYCINYIWLKCLEHFAFYPWYTVVDVKFCEGLLLVRSLFFVYD